MTNPGCAMSRSKQYCPKARVNAACKSARTLEVVGMSVWYDEATLKVGDSLRKKIDEGLASSRFGIVIISHSFFAKQWAQYELDGLVARQNSNDEKVILPIWHNISRDEVLSFSPSLAGLVALNTSVATISEIAKEIAEAVGSGE